jgi:hypothetical protein
MSTSSESKAGKDGEKITTSETKLNNQKLDGDQKSVSDMKKSKFNELIGWLRKWGFNVSDKTKEIKIPGIEFQAEIGPQISYSSGLNTPFYLEFQNDLEDGIIIRTTFELDRNIDIFLNTQNRAKDIELTYIEIGRLVLPLRISFIRDHPFIKLYKVIFISDLNKQFFFDSITDLMNSMSIIIGKWDEKYYQTKPADKKVNIEKRIDDPELEKILKK